MIDMSQRLRRLLVDARRRETLVRCVVSVALFSGVLLDIVRALMTEWDSRRL